MGQVSSDGTPVVSDLGHAALAERARVALRVQDGSGNDAAPDELPDPGDGVLGSPPKVRGELDFAAATGRGVEDGAGRNRDAEHFFQTEGLRADLNVVVVPLPSLAALVFDRVRNRDSRMALRRAELDYVRLPDEAQAAREEGEPPLDAHAGTLFGTGYVRPVMEQATLESGTILGELALDVDEGASPGTEEVVIEGGDRHEVGLVL